MITQIKAEAGQYWYVCAENAEAVDILDDMVIRYVHGLDTRGEYEAARRVIKALEVEEAEVD